MAFGFGFGMPRIFTAPFTPAALFLGGEQGTWYDPSDLPTLFQDSAGTTPVTGFQQPVGLVLDKSKGLVLGSELVTNGDFSNETTGWSFQASATGSVVAGELQVTLTASNNRATFQNEVTVAGRWYKVTATLRSASGQLSLSALNGATILATTGAVNATGTNQLFTIYFLAASTTSTIYFGQVGTESTATYFADNISVKELPGNHAFQTTSASRPVLSARYNLLTKTEVFSDSAWVKTNITLTTGVSDPDGGTSAFTLTSTADFGNILQTTNSSGVVDSTIYVRRRTGTGLVQILRADAQTWTTIAVTSTWTKFTASATAFPAVGSGIRLGTSGDSVDIWHPDLRVSNDALGQPAYQRVNTATDYDTVGFKPYLSFDGVDDSLVTNSIDFTATDKMTVFAGVRKLSDAARGILVELSDGAVGNIGFSLGAPNGVAPNYTASAKGGVLANTVTTFTAPITNVLAVSQDMAAATLAQALRFRVNAATPTETLSGVLAAGNYGNYPIFIGRRNQASLPFHGRLTSLIVVGKALTAAQITSTETWVNGKTGAY